MSANPAHDSTRATSSWTILVAADDVLPAGIASVAVGDLDLVVWRDIDGAPVVMDARCPHQWSHLEAEGIVDGYEIVCTAHFWRFDRTGCGTKLNMFGRRDDKSDVTVYPCRERDGLIEGLLPPSEPDVTSVVVGSA